MSVKVLIIAEHDGKMLSAATAKCVTCAAAIPQAEITIAVCAESATAVVAQVAGLQAVARVLAVEHPAHAHPQAAAIAAQVVALADPYSHILGPSSTFGRDLMPRIAALLDTAHVSDIMAVEGPYRFRRPIYAGNAIVTVTVPEGAKVVGTVRTASFPATAATAGGTMAPIETVPHPVEPPTHTRFVSMSAARTDRPDLQTATRVISGGRAFGSAEAFQRLYRLAEKLGAAVGASRAAVDAGYAPNELQVGQTGKIIAPELYIAVGISGAIQHVTGIKDARTIVAINKDPEAPIFEIADIGLVGDLFEILPQLEELL